MKQLYMIDGPDAVGKGTILSAVAGELTGKGAHVHRHIHATPYDPKDLADDVRRAYWYAYERARIYCIVRDFPGVHLLDRSHWTSYAVTGARWAAELARAGRSARDCPYLARSLAYWRTQPAARLERVIARYARPRATDLGGLLAAIIERVRDAVAILDRSKPDFEYDGEMAADVALNPDLQARITSLAQRGWAPIAYVRLGYLRRPLGEVSEDIVTWRRWFTGLRGVFFDECQHDGAALLGAIPMLASSVGGGYCVLNPGRAVGDDVWRATWPSRSLVVTFEGTAGDYALLRPPAHPRAVHLVYQAPHAPIWPAGLGWSGSTPDGRDGNPWDASA